MRAKLNKKPLVLCVLLLLAPVIAWADTANGEAPAPERITWQKTPIVVALTVGKERRVDFPGPVQVGLPATIQSALRVQSVAGTVYLLAHQPFEATRVMVRAVDSGAIYLVDLSADNEGEAKAAQRLRVEIAVLLGDERLAVPAETHGDRRARHRGRERLGPGRLPGRRGALLLRLR